MSPSDTPSRPDVALRQQAEARWQAQQAVDLSAQTDIEVRNLLQELQIHQIELELQNEALAQSQAALETSRNHYADLYDSAPVGYLTLGPDGMIVQANLTASTLMHVDRQTLIAHRLGVYVAQSHLPVLAAFLARAFDQQASNQQESTGETLSCELTLATPPSAPLSVQLRADPSNRDDRIHVALIDISKRRQAEERLHSSEINFRRLVREAPIPIFIQTNRQFVYVNKACMQLFGTSNRESLMGQSVIERLHPESRMHVSQQFDRLFSAGASEENPSPMTGHLHKNPPHQPTEEDRIVRLSEEKILRFDASEVDVDITAVPFFFENRSGALVFIQDITAEKEATEHKLDLAIKEKRLALLNSFVRDTSHEFRTPLSIIQANAYLMANLGDAGKRKQKLTEIQSQIKGITRLLEAISQSVRLDEDIFSNLETSDLNKLVIDVIDRIRVHSATDANRLTLVLAPDLPQIKAFPARLCRALSEIIDNALRFTPAEGAISVRSGLHTDGVMVEVEDTGPGIDSEAMPHLFEWFYRSDQAHTTQGLGLGLSIAQSIVKSHGGRIEIESQEEKGSLFRIVLLIIAS